LSGYDRYDELGRRVGFSYRKSVKKMGPFRMTASKFGISYSAGVKGARVTRRANGKVLTGNVPLPSPPVQPAIQQTPPIPAAPMPMPMPAPGWYPDNHNPAYARWWDGARWTDHARPF
jgi:hypothetical protein